LAPVCRGRASAVKRRKDQETEHRSQMKNVWQFLIKENFFETYFHQTKMNVWINLEGVRKLWG
jgi:hypothetical protein